MENSEPQTQVNVATQKDRSPRSTSAIPTLNVVLLRQVKQHILQQPLRLDMASWIEDSDKAPCGTVACIAGWAIKLAGIKHYGPGQGGYSVHAENALGISHEQGERLFFTADWPFKFRNTFCNASQSKRARIAAKRIEHFIETGE